MADRKITDLSAAEAQDLSNNNTVLPIVNPDRTSNIDKNRKASLPQLATAMVEQGLVEGPASSTVGRVAVFDNTDGTLLRNGTKVEADLVTGPASANSGRVAVFSGTSGKVLQNGTKVEADLVVTTDSRLSDARTPTAHGNERHTSTFITAAGAPVQSVAGKTGAVTLVASDAGADPAGTAASAVSTHNSATTSVHGIANTANLVLTNDSRLSDASSLTTGTLPIARIADGAVTNAKLENMPSQTIKGRLSAGSGPPENLTQAQVANFLGVAAGVPTGVIVMWSGTIANIPGGWALCNGANGTPDLRDRFVVGAGSTYNPGNIGGSNTVTLSTANVPSHSHTFSGTTSSDGSHTHTVSATTSSDGAHTHRLPQSSGVGAGSAGMAGNTTTSFSTPATESAGAHSHSFSTTSGSSGFHNHVYSGTTSSVGSSTAHENRPPYYALAYIMKL